MQDFKSFEITKEEIVSLAEKMKNSGNRLLMINGYVDKEGNNVITYQYEVGNCIESYKITKEESLPTISHIYDLAAAWPEEELFELMGIKFEGLTLRGRLFLPETMIEDPGHIIVTPLAELRDKTIGRREK